MRFRTKTVLGVALIELALLAVLIGSAVAMLRESNEGELARRVQLGARLLAAASKDALIAQDLATLDSLADEAVKSGQIDFVRILDVDGTVLASRGDPALLERAVQEDSRIDRVDDGIFDWSEAVSVGGFRYGRVNLGVSTTPLQLLLGSARRWAIGIAALEIVLVALFSWLLGSYLTRQLESLRHGSNRLAAGDFDFRVVVRGKDELAQTASAFNRMAEEIGESTRRLREESTQRLLAQDRLEEALARAEERTEQLNAIFELSPDGFVYFDNRGKVKYANPAFERMVGLPLGDIAGLDSQQFEGRLGRMCADPARLAEMLAAGASQCIPGETGPGGSRGQRERRLLELAGPRQRVLQVAVREADARSVSRIVYFRDVTQAIQIEQMKSDFLSHAAHELRTPLASIFGFSELLVSEEFDAAARRDMLMTIHKEAAWLVTIIDELLDLARIEARRGWDLSLDEVKPESLVTEALAALAPDPAIWPLRCDFAAGLPPLRVDRAKLRQALINVVGNAVKFSPAGGPIEVTCSARAMEGQRFVAIAVRDHGIGMTGEQVSRVCERFYRVDNSGTVPGTGLGMAIVKEVTELHGGYVDIASSLGKGTSITLFLPASTERVDAA
jgi:signal transduction histidine kinase